MTFHCPPFQSSNTQSTTRALSALRSTALKYSCEARLTTTGAGSAPSWVLRVRLSVSPQ